MRRIPAGSLLMSCHDCTPKAQGLAGQSVLLYITDPPGIEVHCYTCEKVIFQMDAPSLPEFFDKLIRETIHTPDPRGPRGNPILN